MNVDGYGIRVAIESYEACAALAEICFSQDRVILAQELKIRISRILLHLFDQGMTRPKMRLYGKFIRLDTRLTRFILLALREVYVEIDSPAEEN